jgi:hypothetical protein
MNIHVAWAVTPCLLVMLLEPEDDCTKIFQKFPVYQSAWRHSPKHWNTQQQHCDNTKPRNVKYDCHIINTLAVDGRCAW